MEITLHNDGMDGDEFHQLVAGETGETLRHAAKNQLGSDNLSENQVKAIKTEGGDAYEQLIRRMTEHALAVVKLPQDTPIRLSVDFAGGVKG
ncbi:hypothetical protein EVC62_08320 [Salinicola endophyticus]|uniref:Uncharacterized protein n=1 Tax=Salinicola endophyticus TaxID=1949083 RepID=A0ABY8FFA6_9GAMM|nr:MULTISPECIES: hypothetical protein [Salinicola]WFF41509.1 hypothetical protein EVC62_08320 [Salinicola endophyticus]